MIDSVQQITALDDAHGSGAYSKRPLTLVRGEGIYAYDDAGNRYIDATSGQGVAALGHSHPALVAAVTAQAQTMITCPEIFYNDRRSELYALLSSITPADLNRFFLCNSGAEANEGAIKAACALTGRSGIIATKRAFHGRTLGALSLTWNKKYREPFADWSGQVDHVAYGDLDAVREAITDQTAAVMVEAVQGEGGVHPAEPEYLQGLRALCDEHGVLLVIDEVQAGMGRTGRWFAFEHAGIVPDIVTMGKAIAGGVPMGAVVWREALGELPRSSHGSTFGGNPLAAAASIATITTLRDGGLVAHAAELGAWMMDQLRAMELDAIREVRGRGLMIGMELRGRVTPALKGLQEHGVLALPAGMNVLRLLPPLISTQEQMQVVIDAIRDVLSEEAS